MKRSLGFFALGAISLFSPSCAKQDGLVTVRLAAPRDGQANARTPVTPHVDSSPSASPSPPASVGDMDCYVININAPDIPAAHPGKDNDSPGCPYQGLTSNLATLSQSTLSLKVPPGSARNIQLIGAKTTGPNGCGTATTVDELDALFPDQTITRADGSTYNQKGYALYFLGETTTDLYRDTSVTIQNTYTQATPFGANNQYLKCFGDNGNEDATPSPTSLMLTAGYFGEDASAVTPIAAPAPSPPPLTSTNGGFEVITNPPYSVAFGPAQIPAATLATISDPTYTGSIPLTLPGHSGPMTYPILRTDLVFALPADVTGFSKIKIKAFAGGSGSDSHGQCGDNGVSLYIWSSTSQNWKFLGFNSDSNASSLVNASFNLHVLDYASAFSPPDGVPTFSGNYLIFSLVRNGVCFYASGGASNTISLQSIYVEIDP